MELYKKIEQVELKMTNTEKEVEKLKEQNKSLQASIIVLEHKALDNCLRLRGLIEEKGEDITEIVTGMLAEYLGEQTEGVAFNLDTVYRVNSNDAVQNKLPRDVVVRFTSGKMKEDIFLKSYNDPLEKEGKTVRVLKELPRKVMEGRKQFKPLVDKLKRLKIKFRWEIPVDLSFFFKGKRKIITESEEMWKMVRD